MGGKMEDDSNVKLLGPNDSVDNIKIKEKDLTDAGNLKVEGKMGVDSNSNPLDFNMN